jgi:hypothetical protein
MANSLLTIFPCAVWYCVSSQCVSSFGMANGAARLISCHIKANVTRQAFEKIKFYSAVSIGKGTIITCFVTYVCHCIYAASLCWFTPHISRNVML